MLSRHALTSAAVLLSLAAPVSAHAQFGGLIKKAAKNAATGAVVDKATGAAPASVASVARTDGDLPGEPLNEDQFAALLRGLRRTNTLLAEGAAAQARMGALNTQIQQLYDAHPGEQERYTEQTNKIEMCQRDHIDGLEQARQQAVEKKMETLRTNPAELQRIQAAMMKYTPKLTAAQQSGDVAAYGRLTEQMQLEIIGGESVTAAAKADTAAARRACGALPVKPAFIARLDSLRGLTEKAAGEQREKEQQATAAGATASGMSEAQYGLARERVQLLLQKGDKVTGASPAEKQMLEQHRAELNTLGRALQ